MRRLFILIMALAMPALAQMGSHLKEEFHDEEKYGILIVDGVKGVRNAIHNPEVRVLCFQAFDEELPDQTQQELLAWVREGNSLWFYDARLAPKFGMKPYFLHDEQFKHKAETGVLGGEKRGGYATVALSFGGHAVQTGVGQVSTFLPAIQQGKEEPAVYGSVLDEGDTIALLKFALDSPCIMAMRREGRGLIVFKNLLWTDPHSGDRFQRNLMEYSAGFQVPGPAGQGKLGNPPGPEAEYVSGEPAVPLEGAASSSAPETVDQASPDPKNGQGRSRVGKAGKGSPKIVGSWHLELKDGTTLEGEYEAEELRFETGTGSLKLDPEQLKSLVFGSSVSLDKLTTVKGETSSGLFLSTPIKFRTERGLEEFEKENIVALRRAPNQEQEEL